MKMGGCAAARDASRKERRRGVNLLEDMRSRKERVCEGVVILATVLASANRGHSMMMWMGDRDGSPHGHRIVSGGSAGRKRAA